jgi:hypothetical protein
MLSAFEIRNGLTGMNRNVVLKLIGLMDSIESIMSVIGMCYEHYIWRNNNFFKLIRRISRWKDCLIGSVRDVEIISNYEISFVDGTINPQQLLPGGFGSIEISSNYLKYFGAIHMNFCSPRVHSVLHPVNTLYITFLRDEVVVAELRHDKKWYGKYLKKDMHQFCDEIHFISDDREYSKFTISVVSRVPLPVGWNIQTLEKENYFENSCCLDNKIKRRRRGKKWGFDDMNVRKRYECEERNAELIPRKKDFVIDFVRLF